MFYSTKLAKILVNVTKSPQSAPVTLDEGLRAYMIDYARRGVSPRTMFTAFVGLSRFVDDVALNEDNGQPMPLTKVSRQVIAARFARLAV